MPYLLLHSIFENMFCNNHIIIVLILCLCFNVECTSLICYFFFSSCLSLAENCNLPFQTKKKLTSFTRRRRKPHCNQFECDKCLVLWVITFNHLRFYLNHVAQFVAVPYGNVEHLHNSPTSYRTKPPCLL